MFDLQVPFFIPVWRRVLTVGITLGWAVFEVLTGSPGWGLLFGAAGLYAFYGFFIAWTPPTEDTQTDGE